MQSVCVSFFLFISTESVRLDLSTFMFFEENIFLSFSNEFVGSSSVNCSGAVWASLSSAGADSASVIGSEEPSRLLLSVFILFARLFVGLKLFIFDPEPVNVISGFKVWVHLIWIPYSLQIIFRPIISENITINSLFLRLNDYYYYSLYHFMVN